MTVRRRHVIMSPFPRNSANGWIVDERCVCGRLRSEHADTVAYGHGPCGASGCAKFSWAEMVLGGTGLYPPDWPKCHCGDPVLDGHLTCGQLQCDERGQRDRRIDQ